MCSVAVWSEDPSKNITLFEIADDPPHPHAVVGSVAPDAAVWAPISLPPVFLNIEGHSISKGDVPDVDG